MKTEKRHHMATFMDAGSNQRPYRDSSLVSQQNHSKHGKKQKVQPYLNSKQLKPQHKYFQKNYPKGLPKPHLFAWQNAGEPL